MNFLFALELSYIFYKIQISTNKKIIFKFFVIFVALVRTFTILPFIRKITPKKIVLF